MSESNGCPLCDKPVAGRTSLLGHLEFGHDIADPETYLDQLQRPAEPAGRSWGAGAARVGRVLGVLVAVAAVGAGGFVGYQQFLADDDTEVAADDGDATSTSATSAPSTTTAPETSAPTSAPSTTAPASSTTAAPTTTAAPAEDVAFRAPFLLDAEATGCTRRGDVDVHEFQFRFSGALNITFDGVFYPDDSGNGLRTSTHELPAGSTTYLDQVTVVDPAGREHDVEISPPLYLGGC